MTKNLVFATDPHLNFCSAKRIKEFANHLLSKDPDCIVLAGDISEAPDLETHLRLLEMSLKGVPLYFVCGNHDYYHGSIDETRTMLDSRFKAGGSIWLPTAGVTSLSPTVALVGHDGWYDGGYPEHGDWFRSALDMSDYYIIRELASPFCFNRQMRYDTLQALSKGGADHAAEYLPKAFEDHDRVFFVTHVSPFAETSCGPNGKMSDRDWMPSFCSRLMGEAIMDVMKKIPAEKELIVLCGHSHTRAWFRPLPNVYCLCGQARYRDPKAADQFRY